MKQQQFSADVLLGTLWAARNAFFREIGAPDYLNPEVVIHDMRQYEYRCEYDRIIIFTGEEEFTSALADPVFRYREYCLYRPEGTGCTGSTIAPEDGVFMPASQSGLKMAYVALTGTWLNHTDIKKIGRDLYDVPALLVLSAQRDLTDSLPKNYWPPMEVKLFPPRHSVPQENPYIKIGKDDLLGHWCFGIYTEKGHRIFLSRGYDTEEDAAIGVSELKKAATQTPKPNFEVCRIPTTKNYTSAFFTVGEGNIIIGWGRNLEKETEAQSEANYLCAILYDEIPVLV